MDSFRLQRRVELGGLGALAILKLALIVAYGPLSQPDTEGYVGFARQILTSTAWAHDQPAADGDSSYRMIGYPALISLAMTLAGKAWAHALVAVQLLVGLVAAVALYRFCLRLLPHWGWAVAVVAGYTTSQILVFDLMILTDGLYANLIVAVASLLGLAACGHGRWLLLVSVGGVLLAAAFLVREATLMLAPFFIPLVLLAAGEQRRGAGAYVTALVSFVAPVLICTSLYLAWNHYRSGAAYITTSTRAAALLPLVRIAGGGTPVFDGSGPLDAAAQIVLKNFDYGDALEINRVLSRQGVMALEVDRAVRAKYMETLWRFPTAVAAYALRGLRLERRAISLVNPVRSLIHIQEFSDHNDLHGASHRWRRVTAGEIALLPVVAGELVFVLLAIPLGVLAYIVFPLRYVIAWVRRGTLPRAWHVVAAGWFLYAGFMGVYAMIYLEDRYIIGVTPLAILAGAFVAQDILGYIRQRSSATPG